MLVTRPGFEPRLSEPESEVLPLYDRAVKFLQIYRNKKHFWDSTMWAGAHIKAKIPVNDLTRFRDL